MGELGRTGLEEPKV
jgi:hypothetical protein